MDKVYSRYVEMVGKGALVSYRLIDFKIDWACSHGKNGNPKMDLDKLLKSEALTFLHDIIIVRDNLDRETGILLNIPACAILQ